MAWAVVASQALNYLLHRSLQQRGRGTRAGGHLIVLNGTSSAVRVKYTPPLPAGSMVNDVRLGPGGMRPSHLIGDADWRSDTHNGNTHPAAWSNRVAATLHSQQVPGDNQHSSLEPVAVPLQLFASAQSLDPGLETHLGVIPTVAIDVTTNRHEHWNNGQVVFEVPAAPRQVSFSVGPSIDGQDLHLMITPQHTIIPCEKGWVKDGICQLGPTILLAATEASDRSSTIASWLNSIEDDPIYSMISQYEFEELATILQSKVGRVVMKRMYDSSSLKELLLDVVEGMDEQSRDKVVRNAIVGGLHLKKQRFQVPAAFRVYMLQRELKHLASKHIAAEEEQRQAHERKLQEAGDQHAAELAQQQEEHQQLLQQLRESLDGVRVAALQQQAAGHQQRVAELEQEKLEAVQQQEAAHQQRLRSALLEHERERTVALQQQRQRFEQLVQELRGAVVGKEEEMAAALQQQREVHEQELGQQQEEHRLAARRGKVVGFSAGAVSTVLALVGVVEGVAQMA